MTSETTNEFQPDFRTSAVRLLLDQEDEHFSRQAACTSIAAKIGCSTQTMLNGSHGWRLMAGRALAFPPMLRRK